MPDIPGIRIAGLERELTSFYPHFPLTVPFALKETENIRKYSQKHLILAILKKHGTDSLSYFSLQKSRKYFFSASQKSFLSYCIKGNVAVVGANPVGIREEIPELIDSFIFYLNKTHKKPCFLGVNKNYANYLKKKRFTIFKIGEEAIINLETFDEKLLKKKVRRVLRHMHRSNVVIQIHNRHMVPAAILKQIKQTSKMWLSSRKKEERGFSMTLGAVPTKFHKDCEFIVALKENIVLGYLCFVPVYQGSAWSLDAMRRREVSPNGLMEFLMIQAAKQYKMRGFKKISLNFATFANTKNDINSKLLSRILGAVYVYLSKFYQCKSLHQFNKKFLPDWESRYLAIANLRSIPFSALAILKAEKVF